MRRRVPLSLIMLDTLESRWARLEPHAVFVGPDDDLPRPTALLFHGCGGMRDHLPVYAEAAAGAGWRSVIVDSYAPRGWSRQFALTAVCTGMLLRGWERAGDVLATIQGVSRRPDVDAGCLALGGWSHGGWAIMEALSAAPEAPRALGVVDAEACSLDGVKAAFLAYPFVGPGAVRAKAPWRHCPRTLAVIARRDHLTTVRHAERVHEAVRGCGVEIETWIAEGTHAFDEPTGVAPMRYDPDLSAESAGRFRGLLEAVAPRAMAA